MAVSSDMLRAWTRPRAVMRRLLSMGPREDRALMFLMAACMLIFVAQWPRLSREAHFGDRPMDQLVAYEFAAWLMVWPLAFYGIAALSHLIARAFGGQGDWYGARLALFWALLAASPAALLYGLMTGFVGPGPGTQLAGVIWLAGFAMIWIASLREAERNAR